MVILSLETPGSKVLTENVRQGFLYRSKSLIFPMGIFCTKKKHKIECLEPPSCPNGLKFNKHTLRDSLKNLYIRFLIFWFFAIFWPLKVRKSSFLGDFWRFSFFLGPKNLKQFKYQKSDKYPRTCRVQFLAYLDLHVALNIQFSKFSKIGKKRAKWPFFRPKMDQFSIF